MLDRTAYAIEYPSKVDVPLPNSSTIANERFVACYKICLVSSISIKKVLLPSRILSDAPSLVKIRSTGVRIHFSAGTMHPI
jgi:hypothetical protein